MKNLFSIAAIFAAAFAAVPARLPGATYYAAPSSQGDGSGSSSGNACTLKEAVSKVNADAGGEIVLAPGVYQEDASDTGTGNYLNNKWTYSYYVLGASGQNYPIVVRSASGDPSDTIVKGQYCDNEKYIRLFLAFGNAVRISGLTLCEGAVELSSSAHGGGAVLGIRDTEGGGGLVENCILERNTAAVGAATRDVTVRDSEFRGNVSSWNGSGAAAYCCDVSNCVFTANYTSGQNSTACFHGGGDKFAVYDSTFLCNTNASTSGQGGIVCSAKNAIGCVFVGNTALQSYIVLGCSGVDNVIDCAFTNNTNVSGGYALLAGCTNVIGSTVYGCSGLSYAIVSPTLVSNCTFVANLAGQSPVYGAQETTEIHDSAFLFNTNTANAANASAVKSAKLVARSVFVGNSGSHMYSGAIHGAGRVVDCAFTNNFISASGRGSSGYQCGSFENCSFSGEIGGCGSALYEPDVVSNCTFVACETHERDGGAAIYGKATTCVYDCLIVDCTNVTSSANALAVNNVMRMERCAITGCYSQFGYLIRNFDALVNCAITNNPSIWAAWLYGRDGSSLTNCLIAGNSASNSYTYHGIQNIANLVNCTIVSNTIPGHLVVDSSNSTIWNSIFADNQPYDVSGNALSNSFYVTANAAPDANEGCRQLASIAEVCFSGDPAMPYSLKGRSPARGAGLLLEGLAGTKDLLGHPRIGLDGVDLGCCAYYSRRGFTMVLR